MAEPSDDIFDDDYPEYIDRLAPKIGLNGPDGLPCEKCPKDFAVSFCPHWPCDVCYKDHGHRVCPYFEFYPRGAPLNPRYGIICQMGHQFNEEKWVCTSCPGNEARIIHKWCHICLCYRHGTYECPEDKVAAAKYKLYRDESRSKVFKPNPRIPSKSSYDPSRGFVNIKEASSETPRPSHCGVAAAAEHSKYNQCQISSSSETMPISSETMPISEIACSYSALDLHDNGIPIAFEKIA